MADCRSQMDAAHLFRTAIKRYMMDGAVALLNRAETCCWRATYDSKCHEPKAPRLALSRAGTYWTSPRALKHRLSRPTAGAGEASRHADCRLYHGVLPR